MEWSEIVSDPSLNDLPYKVETNAHGQIVMSPASRRHSRRQSRITHLLNDTFSDGEAFSECPVKTREGTKVPDVVWISDTRLARQEDNDPMTEAPEICVEVLSSSNTQAEIVEKRALYFEEGASEVWVCDQSGSMEFYGAEGPIDNSKLAPEFPNHVPLRKPKP